ncbi:MAG: hypothetical protein ACQERN_06470 [Thermodesulfobacteriota bacterium]
MNCPRCNHPLSKRQDPAAGAPNARPAIYCENCGWTKQRPANTKGAPAPAAAAAVNLTAMTWLKLIGLWGLSAALVIAPYVLLTKTPLLFSSLDPAIFNAETASARMAEALTPLYWIIVMVYVLICATFNRPEVDFHNMGWFGGLVDNPFSFSDDINRTKFKVMLLMIPGKIIVTTLAATYRLIRAVMTV